MRLRRTAVARESSSPMHCSRSWPSKGTEQAATAVLAPSSSCLCLQVDFPVQIHRWATLDHRITLCSWKYPFVNSGLEDLLCVQRERSVKKLGTTPHESNPVHHPHLLNRAAPLACNATGDSRLTAHIPMRSLRPRSYP